MGKVANAIDNKLRAEFAPVRLAIEDESSRHHGHSGYREGGETRGRDQAGQGSHLPVSGVRRFRGSSIPTALGERA